MKHRVVRGYAWIAAAALCASGIAWAADPPAAAGEPTREQRQKMAEVHRKLASCLDSERPFAECRSEMQKDCRERMGEAGCPMLGMQMGPMGGMGSGGMHHGGMQPKEPAK